MTSSAGDLSASSIESEKSLDLLRNQLTIVVPTLNEAESIGKLIDEIKGAGYSEILVIDGYSKDETIRIASDGGARAVSRVINKVYS